MLRRTRRVTTGLVLTFAVGCGGGDKPPASAAASEADATIPTADKQHAEPGDAATKPAAGSSPAHGSLPPGHPAIGTSPGKATEVEPSGDVRTEALGELTLSVPAEWTRGQPSSAMRLAEFEVPGPGGAATLAVFRFPGGGGGVEANLERWTGQLAGEDGAKPEAKTEVQQLGALKVTTLDVTGGYAGSTMPGAPAQASIDTARMFAAIIEGHGDPYFFKLLGAKTTIDRWEAGWQQLVKSFVLSDGSGAGAKTAENQGKKPTGDKKTADAARPGKPEGKAVVSDSGRH